MAQNAGAPPAEATGPVAEDSARAEETLTLISTELARFKPAINMLAVNEQVWPREGARVLDGFD